MLARKHPNMSINACSPGFTNTGMCANYTGTRVPKDAALGADVFAKVAYSHAPSCICAHELKYNLVLHSGARAGTRARSHRAMCARQVLFSDLGAARTGMFFKESSKPGTPLANAISVVDPWVQ